MFTRRIFFGVVMTWVLLEGSKGLWLLWSKQNKGRGGFRGALADDIDTVAN